jgi:hypothetical protein
VRGVKCESVRGVSGGRGRGVREHGGRQERR